MKEILPAGRVPQLGVEVQREAGESPVRQLSFDSPDVPGGEKRGAEVRHVRRHGQVFVGVADPSRRRHRGESEQHEAEGRNGPPWMHVDG